MTKLTTTLTISAIASILVIGGFVFAPDVYSDKKHHDDVPDECSCDKPHTLKVNLKVNQSLPSTEHRVEIFKKLDDRDNEGKQLGPSIPVGLDGDFMVLASNFGKDKLESNTGFVVYEVGVDIAGNPVETLVSLMEIHTSCSKPLFIGMIVDDSETTNNGYTLEVLDGLQGDNPPMTSIPIDEPSSCEDKKQKSTGTITIRKAITNDNGGNANATDFTIKLTNMEDGKETILVHDLDDSTNPNANLNEVPVGTYKITESYPNTVIGTYTTVLITGDDKCPAMVNEAFTIKKGKTLSCTIYNDDNGDGSGEGGIIFRNFSMQVKLGEKDMTDSCDAIPNASDKNSCIEIIDVGAGRIAIVDSELKSDRTIVLFSVTEANKLGTDEGANTIDCFVEGIVRHDKHASLLDDGDFDPIEEEDPTLPDDDPNYPTNPSTNNVVVAKCGEMMANQVYNVNYIMIDPLL